MAQANRAMAAILVDPVFRRMIIVQDKYINASKVAGLINILTIAGRFPNQSLNQPSLITININVIVVKREKRMENNNVLFPGAPENHDPM